MWHQCNQAAKESGLECTWVKNDFTVLVIAAVDAVEWTRILCGYHIQNEWVEQWICVKFWVKLEHSSMETIHSSEGHSYGAPGDWQLHHNNVPAHIACLMQSFLVKHQLTQALLQVRFGALWLLALTKITFEKDKISDHRGDSGKYDKAADGNWKNCVRS